MKRNAFLPSLGSPPSLFYTLNPPPPPHKGSSPIQHLLHGLAPEHGRLYYILSGLYCKVHRKPHPPPTHPCTTFLPLNGSEKGANSLLTEKLLTERELIRVRVKDSSLACELAMTLHWSPFSLLLKRSENLACKYFLLWFGPGGKTTVVAAHSCQQKII